MSFFMIHPTQSSTLFPYTTLFRSIPNAGIVVQVQPAGRHRTFNLSADEMNRNKLAAKLHHFRTADSRLEPLAMMVGGIPRSEEHTSELQSHHDLVCRLLLEKKKQY